MAQERSTSDDIQSADQVMMVIIYIPEGRQWQEWGRDLDDEDDSGGEDEGNLDCDDNDDDVDGDGGQ